MITDNGLEAMLDFRHGGQQTFSLVDAQEHLQPRLKILDKELQKVCEKHGISESLINTARDAEACSAYIVGIVPGVWLANRPDILDRSPRCTPRPPRTALKFRSMMTVSM